jgi:hypothetical protein
VGRQARGPDPGRESKEVGMADRVLFIGWGSPVRGREERGLEVFNEAIGLYGRWQQEGRIERFDVVLLQPSPSIDGYIELHGTAEQLAALREDKEFQRITIAASLITEGLQLVDGVTNAGIAEQMEMYQEAVSKVPQIA